MIWNPAVCRSANRIACTTTMWSATIIKRFMSPPPWASSVAFRQTSVERGSEGFEIHAAKSILQTRKQGRDLFGFGHADFAEQPGGVRMAILRGLELEHAQPGAQLQVQGQGTQQVLQRL